MITENGGSRDEINRINESTILTKQLNSFLWSDTITRNTEICIYKALVENTSIYGVETWGIKK
jgi:hypothetical protein